MPVAAKCPSCGAALSETSVLALAPVCGYCGCVIPESGGTLGLTSAYGVNDPTITRQRVQADLGVFLDCKNKYVGMLEASKEQLKCGLERYAKLPNPPELLPEEKKESGVTFSGCLGFVVFFSTAVFCILRLEALISKTFSFSPDYFEHSGVGCLLTVVSVWFLFFCFVWAFSAFVAFIVNDKRPLENARRQRTYKAAYEAAMKAAEPVKAAQDHRLRCQIRELEGLIVTMTRKAEDIRGILDTL